MVLKRFFYACLDTESEKHSSHGLTKTLIYNEDYLNSMIDFVVFANTRLPEFVRFLQITVF